MVFYLRPIAKSIFGGFCSCPLYLSSICFSMQRLIFELKENREHRDSNPGQLGEKCERYLCAMLPTYPPNYKELGDGTITEKM